MSSSSSSRPQTFQSPATHPALHLRDARDAHIVFEAVRQRILPLITRRITAIEREQVVSGNVFVWEEAEHKQGGLERWTDGRRWSQSRMRGDYLFYEEKIETTPEEKEAKAARRARKTLDPFSYQPAPTRRQDRPSKPDGLTKQTYSTHVHVSNTEPPRKWHIVAYFSVHIYQLYRSHITALTLVQGDDYTRLPVVDNYEYLRGIRIPDGVYSSAKGNLTKAGRMLTGMDGPPSDYERSPTLSHPGWGTPTWSVSSSSRGHDIERPLSSSSSSSSSPTTSYQSTVIYPTSGAQSRRDTSLPRLSTIAPAHRLPPSPYQGGISPTTPYSPLTAEDRRALNSFRVVL
ncbi:Gti1/Pac2 family-domain-containing protein [Cristinia sonorae]|uniref:Gti1/Pac2 family-domain-containing protein n=1 Tax=Cristinia sonorae TaxID=1940300 RepID=A0A8K0UI79_9AGAR|nr:Gti1/Pac2 family-domain-containing protein [Cristinia sonorae]